MRRPRDAGDLGYNRRLIDQLPGEHQVGAPLGLDDREQLPIALANGGKQDVAQGALRSLANVHQHGHQLVVFRIEDGADRRELQAQGNDLGPKEIGNRQNRNVAPALQFKSKGYQRMDVAEGTEAGEDNAHALLLQCKWRADSKRILEKLEAVFELELLARFFAGLEQRCARS